MIEDLRHAIERLPKATAMHRTATVGQLGLAFGLLLGWFSSAAPSQEPLRPPDPVPPNASGTRNANTDQLSVVAGFTEGRIGVARVRLPTPLLGLESGDVVHVDQAERRSLYPAFREMEIRQRSARPLPPPGERRIGGGQLLRRLAQVIESATAGSEGAEQTVAVEVLFLFHGADPFEVAISGPINRRVTIDPQPLSADQYHALLWQWWDAYQGDARRRIESADYPPIVETYLATMLSSRLGFDSFRVNFANQSAPSSPMTTLALLAGAESLRIEAVQTAAQGPPGGVIAPASLEVPNAVDWSVIAPPTPGLDDVAVEEIATRVPDDCFYLRFGPFSNFLWFQGLAGEYGGDIAQMVTRRGVNFDTSRRIEDRLNLRYSTMARLFGDSVIEDMVVVGYDMFFVEGAAFGVLFKARNPLLLSLSLNQDRQATQRSVAGCVITSEEISGRQVSLLNTPDQTVRSFMVQEGPWIFVSSSRKLMEGFLSVVDGGQNLASDPQFRYCRQQMPASTDYTIFAYFSTKFFQRLISPHTQIELRRRMAAAAELSVVRLAQLAAQAEGSSAHEIDELIEEGFLPRGFGERPDGSGLILAGDDEIDSMRGRRGGFLPICDTPLTRVTAAEAAWYATVAQFYSSQWQQLDPLFFGVTRSTRTDAERREQLVIHAEVAPLVPEKYGWIARQLGPPTNVAIRPAPDDVAFVQAHVMTEQLGPVIPPHHLFAGIKDMVPPTRQDLATILRAFLALRVLPAYLGAWPQPGVLDRLPLRLGQGQPVSPEISRLIGGLFRYQANGFSVLSFSAELLEGSAPYWAPIEVDDNAQFRALVREIVGTRLERWAAERLFERSYAASLSGARLLDALDSQLRVPPEQATAEAARLLGGELNCPLGGTYQQAAKGERQRWQSTAWGRMGGIGIAPTDYQPPLMKWFRGIDARVLQEQNRVIFDGQLEIERQSETPPAASNSPN